MQPSPRFIPHSHPAPRSRRARKLAALAALGLTGLLAGLLSGCATGIAPNASASSATPTSSSSTPTTTPDYTAASGNWLFTTGSARLATLSGSLTVQGTTVSGTLHPLAGTCFTAPTAFAVAGSVASGGALTLTSTDFPGGTLQVSGTLASDLHSLQNPMVAVTGGACATAHAAASPQPRDTPPGSSAQQYQALSGTYTGTLTSSFGGSLSVTANITQSTNPDSNGNYHLSGTSTFSGGGCVSSPVITDSVVSGKTVSTTYTDPNTGASVNGTGTFSADAQTLTIAAWTLSGNCGSDHGVGTLTRH